MPAVGLFVPVIIVVLWFVMGLRVVNEYEQGVVLRLGRYAGLRTAGLKWIVPFIDRMIVIDMRVTAEQVPPQDVITRDNVSVKVSAVIYFRVLQADRAFVKVTAVEVKQVDLPEEMRRAMARQAEAERERRSKIIAAEGEFQAAEKLGQAADVIARSPGALQLRYMQTLIEISTEKTNTILFPLPLDM